MQREPLVDEPHRPRRHVAGDRLAAGRRRSNSGPRGRVRYIVGDFAKRRDTGDSTVFCYPQVMMTAAERAGRTGYDGTA